MAASIITRPGALRRAVFPISRYAAVYKLQNRNYATEMAFTFDSATESFYSKSNIRQVDVPSFSGSFGILPSHVPTVAQLKPGVVTVFEQDGATKKYFVSSGSVAVNADSSVQLFAQEAVPLERLDQQACKEGLSKAQQQMGSATTDEARAEAQIAIEVNEELVKAIS